MTYRNVTHVIFDCDGVLLDTLPLYRSVFNTFLAEHGIPTDADIFSSLLGRLEVEIIDNLIKEYNLPLTIEEALQIMRKRIKDTLPFVTLLPGVKRLVDHLHKHKIPMAVATSSSTFDMDLKTKNHRDVFAKFNHMVLGSSDPEVKAGKPDPQIFLVCASRFPDKPKPENCLVFEDAINGVEAALAGGMQALMIPIEENDRKHRAKATLAVSSLEEFKPELFGLPPFTH